MVCMPGSRCHVPFRSGTPGGRLLCALGLASALTPVFANGVAQDKPRCPPPTVQPAQEFLCAEINEGLLSLQAQEVTVRAVLEQVAHQSRLALVLYNPLDERISIKFDRLPVREALHRLLRHRNFALQLVQHGAVNDMQTHELPGTLWVFPDATRPDSGPDYIAVAAPRMTPVPSVPVDVPKATGSAKPLAALAADLQHADFRVREEAIDALGDHADPSAIRILERALADPHPEVRASVIDSLVDIGGDAAAMVLGAALGDADTSLRLDTVDALAEIGGNIATGLLHLALGDEQLAVRETARECLDALQNPQ